MELSLWGDEWSMFKDGRNNSEIKPLQIIWGKFPQWVNKHNTWHIDDLEQNFQLNLSNGRLVTPYHHEELK